MIKDDNILQNVFGHYMNSECDVGITMNKISKYLKNIIDFLIIINIIIDRLKVMGFEWNIRCDSNTESIARQIASRCRNKHLMWKWDDPKLSKAVPSPHGLMKCLRHVEIFDFDCILLLIGDRSTKIMQGVFIVHDEMIKSVCKRLLIKLIKMA